MQNKYLDIIYFIFNLNNVLFQSVGGDDFDDVEDDDNIDDLNQEEEVENFEILQPGQQGGGVPKNKRITTRYMTK